MKQHFLVLLLLCGFLFSPAQEISAGYVLPVWIQRKEHLLPPVAPEVVVQMRKDWDVLHSADFEDLKFKPDREFIEAAQRVAGLGETASLALVWLYVQEARFDDDEITLLTNRKSRLRLVSSCRYDPVFAQWVLAVMRIQMPLLESEARAHPGVRTIVQDDILVFSTMMLSRGEDADLEQFARLAEIYHGSLSERIRPEAYTLQRARDTRQLNGELALKRDKTIAQVYRGILANFGIKPEEEATGVERDNRQ